MAGRQVVSMFSSVCAVQSSVNFELTYNEPAAARADVKFMQKTFSVGADNEFSRFDDERSPLMLDSQSVGGGPPSTSRLNFETRTLPGSVCVCLPACLVASRRLYRLIAPWVAL